MTTDILFTGSLDQCHEWANKASIPFNKLNFVPTDGAKWTGDGWSDGNGKPEYVNGECQFNVTKVTFESLVSECTAPNSDLEKSVIGLLMFANFHAEPSDIETFMNWLSESTTIRNINTATTTPSDHFECAQGQTWENLETYYHDNI